MTLLRRLRGPRRLITGVVVVVAWVVVLGWWVDSSSAVRSVLESSPLAGNVADEFEGEGDPLLVASTVGAIVALALAGIWLWRRRLLRSWVANRVDEARIHLAGVILVLVLVLGTTLVPVAWGIAAGDDLREADPAGTFTLPFTLVVLAVVAGFAWWSSERSMRDAADNPIVDEHHPFAAPPRDSKDG